MTLTEFLLARIAEDETAAAYAATRDGDLSEHDMAGWWIGHYHHYPRHNPSRVLADCAAKRSAIHAVRGWFADQGDDDPAGVLRALATAYVNHSDYREEWKP